jgi:hypothetical protein
MQKAAAERLLRRRPPSASVSRSCFYDDAALTAAIKFDLPGRNLRQHGYAVLDAQPFDLTVPQIAAKLDELAPRGRQHGIAPGLRLRHRDHLPIFFAHEDLYEKKWRGD